jgi:hypothetical protein
MIKELTDEEIDYIMEYTGVDIALRLPLNKTPVICFSHNGNVLDFVTIFSTELNKA